MGGISFDRVAARYDETRGGAERAATAAADVVGHLPAGDILEIGVGTGIVAEAVLRSGQVRRLAGVDIPGRCCIERAPGFPGVC